MLFAATIARGRPYIITHGTSRDDVAMKALNLLGRLGLGGPLPLFIGTPADIGEHLGATGRVLLRRYLRTLAGLPVQPDPVTMDERRRQILDLRDRAACPLQPSHLAEAIFFDGADPADPAVRRRLAASIGSSAAPAGGDTSTTASGDEPAAAEDGPGGDEEQDAPQEQEEGLVIFGIGTVRSDDDPDGQPRTGAFIGFGTGRLSGSAPRGTGRKPSGARRVTLEVCRVLGLRRPNRWARQYVEHAVAHLATIPEDHPDTAWPGTELEAPEDLQAWLAGYPLALDCIEAAWKAFGLGDNVWEDLELGLEWMSKQVFDLTYRYLARLC